MRVVNLLLFLGFFFLAGSGLLLTLKLPHGSGGRLAVLGMDRHAWGEVHLYVALGVLALTVLHLYLNWAWLKKIAAKAKVWPLALAFAAGLVLVLGPLLLPVDESQGGKGMGPGGQGHQWKVDGLGVDPDANDTRLMGDIDMASGGLRLTFGVCGD